MANLIVTLTSVQDIPGLDLPVEIADDTTSEQIAIGGSSAQGTNVPTVQKIANLVALAACWVAFGTNPTAVAGSGRYIMANERVHLVMKPGHKIAVITG